MIDHPLHWNRGQLLDLRRYEDSQHKISYRGTLLGEDWTPIKSGAAQDKGGLTKCEWETLNAVFFDTQNEAQDFVSTWYAQSQARYG